MFEMIILVALDNAAVDEVEHGGDAILDQSNGPQGRNLGLTRSRGLVE